MKVRNKREESEGSRQIGEEGIAMEVREENRKEDITIEDVRLGTVMHTCKASTWKA